MTACGGKSVADANACDRAIPPPITTEDRVLRLDVLDLGEARTIVSTPSSFTATPRAPSYGYDLDGLCSDGSKLESLACRRVAGASAWQVTDADGGVDNSFGRNLLSWLESGYPNPSAAMSGFSYLETKRDGSGTLYLGTNGGVRFVIPLIDVRIAPPAGDALGMLTAIAPREALRASVRDRFDLAFGESFCNSTTVETIDHAISRSADLRVDGAPNPDLECDGISIAMRVSGTTVPAAPAIGPGCPPPK